MHSVTLLFAILGLAFANKIVFPDSDKKTSTPSTDDTPAKGTPSDTETRSFFHPNFGASLGHHGGVNHHQGDNHHLGGGDFVGGPHLPGGFNVPPHAPHGPHHGVHGSHGPHGAHQGPHGSHNGPHGSHNGPHGSHHGSHGSHHGPHGTHHGAAGAHHPIGGPHSHQHVGPVIPVTDPLSSHLGGNPAGFPVSGGCRFWCRTPKGQVYCCEGANEPQNLVGVKAGVCPPSRPACPPTRSLGPPKACSNDGSCVGVDKCCFDTCLQEHTCKPPQGFGR